MNGERETGGTETVRVSNDKNTSEKVFLVKTREKNHSAYEIDNQSSWTTVDVENVGETKAADEAVPQR